MGDFDFDGDGRTDVAYASTGYSDKGGFSVLRGRPWVAGGIDVLCDETDVLGTSVSSNLGTGLAALGDVDGDGCDELAVGADADDLGATYGNQGSARVIWGYGAGCAGKRVTTLAPLVANVRAGRGLAGGRDVDDDGVPDLVVGGYDSSLSASSAGAVWLVSGATLRGLPTNSWDGVALPADTSAVVNDLDTVGFTRTSTVAGADYGWSVALVPNPDDAGRAYVAIGAPFSDLGGAAKSGGVELWRWGAGGFEATPRALVLGETAAGPGEMGGAVWGGVGPGGDWLLVGANQSDAVALDGGAVFAFPIDLE